MSEDGLRARRRALTEREIEDSALSAFESRGFAQTTMEQIAAGAGVSLRTAFRYFPTKVDTALFSARHVAQVLGDKLRADLTAGASLAEIEDAVAGSLSTFADANADVIGQVRRAYALMLSDGQLRAQVVRSEDYLTGIDHQGAGAGRPSLRTRVLAEIVAATVRAAFDDWAGSDGEDSLVSHYHRARAARDSLTGAPGSVQQHPRLVDQ